MRPWAVWLLVSGLWGCYGSAAPQYCPAPGPDAGVEPECWPIMDEERCMPGLGDRPCPSAMAPWPMYVPFDLEITFRGIAYVEVLTGSGFWTSESGAGCTEVVRYRVGLRDGVLAQVGGHCVADDIVVPIAVEATKAEGWTQFMRCRVVPDLDLEVRIVPAGASGCAYGGEWCASAWERSAQPVIWIRRHSTGELVRSYWLYPPWSSAACAAHLVQPPAAQEFPGCAWVEGCNTMCGYPRCIDQGPPTGPVAGTAVGTDGLCYDVP